MKTVFFKTVFAAVIVIFALILGTCAPELLEDGIDGVEYTDVEYEIYGGVGNERVKSIKLYLDGNKVPVTPKQRAIQRALSLDTAAASHDFFEVVFYANVGPGGTPYVARATWEIGQPAGINGVYRNEDTGVNYGPVYGGFVAVTPPDLPIATAPSAPCSTVFVGKKANKTLLGVGWLTHVNDAIGSTVRDSTTSVTFYVAPLKTWVGYYESATGVWSLRGKSNWYGTDANQNTGNIMTFMTATGAASTTPAAGPWTTVDRDNTRAVRQSFNPTGEGAVYYPLYALPLSSTSAGGLLSAEYRIGGLDILPDNVAGGTIPNPTGNTLWPAVRVYGQRTADTNIVRGGLQVIKRRPTLIFKGNKYQAGTMYDSSTSLALGTYQPNTSHVMLALNAAGNSQGDTSSAQFNPLIPLSIRVTNSASGIFAFTFQCPVFAITTRYSDNPGAGKFTKWFVRPADGPDLYLLDNGVDDGGMVMLGDVGSVSDDWIQIITTGIGFDND